MANVFISHRSDDNNEAERLATELRNAGHDVWLDLWKINLGDSIIERINSGLTDSSYVVVCYSSAGIESAWMGREWMSALAQQLNGTGVKIFPVVLTGGQPPAILADIKYVNLVKDWTSGIAELLRSIR